MNRHLNLIKESDIEKKLNCAVTSVGGVRYKFVSPGRPGVPDNIVLMPLNTFYLVECKRPKGGVYSPLQINFAEEVRTYGVKVWRVYDDASLKDFIDHIVKVNLTT